MPADTSVDLQTRSIALIKLPLDMVFEVFENLNPSDLLTLIRVNKPLRWNLLSKSFGLTWRTVLNRADLPNGCCPAEMHCMSLPNFARLAYDEHCYSCGTICALSRRLEHVVWADKVRLCEPCIDKQFKAWTGDNIADFVSHAAPELVGSEILKELLDKLLKLVPYYQAESWYPGDNPTKYFHVETCSKYLQEGLDQSKDPSEVAAWLKEKMVESDIRIAFRDSECWAWEVGHPACAKKFCEIEQYEKSLLS